MLDLFHRPASSKRVLEAVLEARPGGVGIYGTVFNAGAVCGLVAALRAAEPRLRIVVGGPGFAHRERHLHAGADGVFLGEADLSMPDLARFCRGELPAAAVPGLYHAGCRDGGFTPAPVPTDLDALPFPDWDLVPPGDFHDYMAFTADMPYFTVVASRGCPMRCAYCYSGNCHHAPFRARGVESVLDELEQLVRRRGVRYVAFQDDAFGFAPGFAEGLATGILQRGLRFRFSANLYPTLFRGRRREVFGLLRRAGLDLLSFGAQSAVGPVLERVGRNAREPGLLLDALREASDLGICTAIEFIFGLPGDTPETLAENVRFALASGAVLADFHTLGRMPGTLLDAALERRAVAVMPEEEARRAVRGAFLRFYSDARVIRRLLRFGAHRGAARAALALLRGGPRATWG